MKAFRISLALLAPLCLAPAADAQVRAPGYLTLEGLEDDIALSLRWLRSQQDPETGAYGDVQVTCFVLKAFAQSPWAYTVEDGPFVARAIDRLLALQRKDGAICEPNAGRLQQRQHTGECMVALAFFEDAPGVAEALKACKRFTEPPPRDASWESTFEGLDDAPILKMAEDTLVNRKPEGWWENPLSRVRGTAVNTERLCGIHQALRSREIPLMASDNALPVFAAVGRDEALESARKGAAFLVAAGPDGLFGWKGKVDAEVTALAAAALLAVPERGAAADAAAGKALDWLVSLQQPDGSIHHYGLAPGRTTALAVLALARAGREQDRAAIAKARAFLEALQADEAEGYQAGERSYGGIGDGQDLRPSLASSGLALDALRAAGAQPADATLKRAVVFLGRCQNLPANAFKLVRGGGTVKSGDDGGAADAPGASRAGTAALEDGALAPRSTGSATALLLKGYLQAGVPREDPRAQAALAWLAGRFELEIDPGFEQAGAKRAAHEDLYGWLHALAGALDASGEETLTAGLSAGSVRPWRPELAGRLKSLQGADGAWVNQDAEDRRASEGNPVVATSLALLALEAALPPAE